jgi:hypothetical protein
VCVRACAPLKEVCASNLPILHTHAIAVPLFSTLKVKLRNQLCEIKYDILNHSFEMFLS